VNSYPASRWPPNGQRPALWLPSPSVSRSGPYRERDGDARYFRQYNLGEQG